MLVESCEMGMMRDVTLDVDRREESGREEDFIAFGR